MVDVVSGAASEIFFFPRNPPDVDGDPVDVSAAGQSTTEVAAKKFFLARAREFLRSQIKSSGLFCVRPGCVIFFPSVFFFCSFGNGPIKKYPHTRCDRGRVQAM